MWLDSNFGIIHRTLSRWRVEKSHSLTDNVQMLEGSTGKESRQKTLSGASWPGTVDPESLLRSQQEPTGSSRQNGASPVLLPNTAIATNLWGHISPYSVPATTTVFIFLLPFGLVLVSRSPQSRDAWCIHDPLCVRNAPGGHGRLSVGNEGTSFLGWPSALENQGRIVN